MLYSFKIISSKLCKPQNRFYQMRVTSGVEHGALVPDVVHHGEGVLRPDLDHVLQGDHFTRFRIFEWTLEPEGHLQ